MKPVSTVDLPIAGAFDPREEARSDLRRLVGGKLEREEYGVGKARQRLLDVPQVGHHLPLSLRIAIFVGAQTSIL